jgi:hypothetical protein
MTQAMELGRIGSKCGESHVSTCQVTLAFSMVYLAQGSYYLAEFLYTSALEILQTQSSLYYQYQDQVVHRSSVSIELMF